MKPKDMFRAASRLVRAAARGRSSWPLATPEEARAAQPYVGLVKIARRPSIGEMPLSSIRAMRARTARAMRNYGKGTRRADEARWACIEAYLGQLHGAVGVR